MKSYYLQSDIDEICTRLDQYKELFKNKNIIITGGNGFLGKYFQAVLHQFGANILVFDKSEPDLKIDGIKYYEADISYYHMNQMFIILSNPPYKYMKFDYIISAASIASPKIYKNNPIETMDVGYNGLKICLDFAKRYKANLLYFSSSEVYQTADIIPTPETYVGAIPSNGERSCYDLSKIVGECLTYNYVKKYNIDAKIVLPFNFYGPQIPDGRVMPSFMMNTINNTTLQVYDKGNETRCYTYITDGIVGCLLTLLNGKSGEKYNIGNPNNEISVSNLASEFKKINNDVKIELSTYPDDYAGGSNPTRRVPNITKAKKELAFEPIVPLEDGIRRFYNWASENYYNL